MEEDFERSHAKLDLQRRRRDELRVARARAADPVLAAAKFAGLLFGPAPTRQKLFVDLAQQAIGERKAVPQPRHAVLQRGHIVGDLHHIIKRRARGLFQFEQQQVGQRRLGTLDLAGEHRLAAHIGIQKQIRIRQQGGDAVETTASQQCLFQQALARAAEVERGRGRQGRGHESPHCFTRGAGDVKVSGGAALHRCCSHS